MRPVASWTTIDTQISYRQQTKGISWQFVVDAHNVFDRGAPFLNNPAGVGYDEQNASLLGRTLSATLRIDLK
jgi:hypothetical protein